ncbi:ABC transporter substrate-binding protein [Glutamicibacter sp.]|uniref:ABC transporter substrate-binding protein n=1 Tax=Glutamicibacter sp. TaxID=1931995 RepID=UPI003D6ADE2D
MMKTRKLGVLAASAAIVALGITSCSSNTSSEAGEAQGPLTVSVDGTTSGAAITLGMEQGFFEDEGLELEITTNGNPPAASAALQSNKVDIGSIPLIPGINAQKKGIQVTSIAPVVGYPEDVKEESEFDTYGVYVNSDSGISSPKDLEGKKVGVNARKAIFEAFVTDEVAKDGGNPENVEWIALDFGSQIESLKSGRVDAITLPMPFTLEAEANGAEKLWSPGVAFYEGGMTSTWMVGPEMSKDNETIAKFQRAVMKSNAYANEHRDEAIATAAELTGIEEKLIVDSGKFTYFPTVMDSSDISRISEKLVGIGFLDSPLQVTDKIAVPLP